MNAYCFDEIWISESLWQIVNPAGERNRLFKLIQIIENTYLNSILDGKALPRGVQSIKGKHKYKINYDHAHRVPFEICEHNNTLRLRLGEVLDHDAGEELHHEEYFFDAEEYQLYLETASEESTLFPQKPNRYIYRNLDLSDEERILASVDTDLRYVLNKVQQTFLDEQGPILLRGIAGSGKTTVCLYRLLRSQEPSRLYVTYTQSLRRYAHEQYQRLSTSHQGHPPVFLSLEELCLSLLGESDRFSPQDKMTFDQFQSLSFVQRAVHQYGVSAYILWEEIRGVLKQNSNVTDLSDYRGSNTQVQIVKATSLVYQKYLDYLRDKGMWDDVDLAWAALGCLPRLADTYERYDDIIVDEVQDLTDVHLQLILRLAKSPQGVFMAGDASQSIHPSRFEWKKAARYLQIELYRDCQYPKPPFRELKEVYRTPESVLSLAQAVMTWRAKVMGSDDDLVIAKTYKLGGAPVELLPFNSFADFHIEIAPPSVMVLVPTDACKDAAQTKFGIGSVFSVQEAKGLESPVVILYGFFEEPQIHFNLNRLQQFIHLRSRDYATLLNLLHVAITRTSEQLYIISDREKLLLPPLEKFTFAENDGDSLQSLLTQEPESASAYFKRGQTLEEAGIYPQAAANYATAAALRHPEGYAFQYKCEGLIAKQKGDYELASQKFEQALESIPEKYQEELGWSIIIQVEECHGMAALAKGDLSTASEKLISAELPVGVVVQHLCSTKSRNRYIIALKTYLIYEQRLAENSLLVDQFFQRFPNAISEIDLELDTISELPQYPEASLRAAQLIFRERTKNLQIQLRSHIQAIDVLAKTLDTEGLGSFRKSEIFIGESDTHYYESACKLSQAVAQHGINLQDLTLALGFENLFHQWSLQQAQLYINKLKETIENAPKVFDAFLQQAATHSARQIRQCLFSESLRKWINSKHIELFVSHSSTKDVSRTLLELLDNQDHLTLSYVKAVLKLKYKPDLCQQIATHSKVTPQIQTLCERYDYHDRQIQMSRTFDLLKSIAKAYQGGETEASIHQIKLGKVMEKMEAHLTPIDPDALDVPLSFALSDLSRLDREASQTCQRVLSEMSHHSSLSIRAAGLLLRDSPQPEQFAKLILSSRISELADLREFCYRYNHLDASLRQWLSTKPNLDAVRTLQLVLSKVEQKLLCADYIKQQQQLDVT